MQQAAVESQQKIGELTQQAEQTVGGLAQQAEQTVNELISGEGGQDTSSSPSQASNNLLNPPIDITQQGLQHVLDRHTYSGIQKFANKSKFLSGEDIKGLIEEATQIPMSRQANGNYQRIVDAGRTIGINRTTNQHTSIYTVISNTYHALVTAFPGLP